MRKLTDKSIKFCQEYVKNGYQARQAYMVAFGQEDPQRASVWAYNLLKDFRVKGEIEAIEWDFKNVWALSGITKEKMIWVLKDMMEAEKIVGKSKDMDGNEILTKAPDHTTRYNGVMWFAKLIGALSERKPAEIESDIQEYTEELGNLSTDQLKEERTKILESMKIV